MFLNTLNLLLQTRKFRAQSSYGSFITSLLREFGHFIYPPQTHSSHLKKSIKYTS